MKKLQEMKITLCQLKDGKGKLNVRSKMPDYLQLSLLTVARELLVTKLFSLRE